MTSEQLEPGADPPRPAPLTDPNPHEPTNRPVVVIVHGIRDFALWQNTIRAALEEVGFDVEATNYGRLNLLQFLVPITSLREKAIATVWRQIRIIKQTNPHTPISVIAHSFGTFVVSELMKENFDVQFDRIIFCGSVVPYGFEYEQIQGRFHPPIINEVGTRDIWPAMAESITWGYGSAGTYGFRRPLVRDRWHNGARHGYFLNREFCTRFWIPFLKDGKIVPGAETPEQPRAWLRFASVFRLKYMSALIATALLVLLYVDRSPKISPSPSLNSNTAQLDEPAIPPDPPIIPIPRPTIAPFRLLSATPSKVRVDKCRYGVTCGVVLFVRGYDADARVRYDHRELLDELRVGEEKKNPFETVEKMYIDVGDTIAFRVYCDMYETPRVTRIGDYKEFHWDDLNEEADINGTTWLSCAAAGYKASVGIDIRPARLRTDEAHVKTNVAEPPRFP